MIDQLVSELKDHVGYRLRVISNAVSQAFSQQLSRFDITVAEWVVMRVLFDAVHPIAPSQLADQMGLTRGAVSKLIDRLVKKGLVQVEKLPGDRRFQWVALSELGRKQVPNLADLADANDAHFFDILSAHEGVEFRRILDRLIRYHRLGLHPID